MQCHCYCYFLFRTFCEFPLWPSQGLASSTGVHSLHWLSVFTSSRARTWTWWRWLASASNITTWLSSEKIWLKENKTGQWQSTGREADVVMAPSHEWVKKVQMRKQLCGTALSKYIWLFSALVCWMKPPAFLTNLWPVYRALWPVSDVKHKGESIMQRPGRGKVPWDDQPLRIAFELPHHHRLWRVWFHCREIRVEREILLQLFPLWWAYYLKDSKTQLSKKRKQVQEGRM